MKTLLLFCVGIFILVIAYFVIGIIYGLAREKRNLEKLKKQEDSLLLKLSVKHDRVIAPENTVIHSATYDVRTYVISNGFIVVPFRTPTALYNKDICPNGSPDISWNVEMEKCRITNDDSLQIDCELPDDHDFDLDLLNDPEKRVISRFTFINMLHGANKTKVLHRLGLEDENGTLGYE
jgi:hypothetical protein